MFRAVSLDSSGHVTPCISHKVKFVRMDWKPPCFTSVSTYAPSSTRVLKVPLSFSVVLELLARCDKSAV